MTARAEGSASDHETSARPPKDVVFTLSYETWTDMQTRGMMRPPDRIAETLMSSDRVGKLLIANPWRWVPSALARRALRLYSLFPESDRRTLHSPLRMLRSDPTSLPGIERAYRAYDSSLARAADAFGLRSPAVVTTSPVVAGFSPLHWAENVTYFGRDDWLSAPSKRRFWPAYREAYRRIAASGMTVTAVSPQIIERIAPRGPAAVIPNGVDPREWLGSPPAPPAWFAAIPGPRAVYVGTLDSRVDVAGLAALARRSPWLQIVLIGPSPEPAGLLPLRELANVHVHPEIGRAELVATLRSAELALLAHHRTPLTEAMSPLKVYEYLAAGAPVIATDLPPVRGFGDRVIRVDTVADFADVAHRALALGPQAETERISFVRDNSWASRHEKLLSLALP